MQKDNFETPIIIRTEAAPAAEDPTEYGSAGTSAEPSADNSTATLKRTGRRKNAGRKRHLLLIYATELLVAVIAVLILTQNISLNSGDKIIYADQKLTDEISCSNGKLIVNNVTAQVRAVSGVSYSISYSWGSEDTEYPTIPHAATASYKDKKGALMYDISLYRDSFTPASKLEKGVDATNWFESWQESDQNGVVQSRYESDSLKGFLISTLDQNDDKNETGYLSESFYFAVDDTDGISIYILEGILYDRSRSSKLHGAIEKSISSISIQ